MKKNVFKLLIAVFFLLAALPGRAQKVTTKAVDNKGTIVWLLDSATAVITKGDSTILYVTPTQHGSHHQQPGFKLCEIR